MMVKGQSFIIDVSWNDQQDLQQQQDTIFTSANEHEVDRQSVRKYLNVNQAPDNTSHYILKSGLKVNAAEHDFDTFLQFTLKTNCTHIESKLHCEYKAIDGLYSVDLPSSMSSRAEQTPEQMEKNEILTLSKLITRPIKITDTFNTIHSLSTLKTKLVKQRFLVDSKKSNLYLSRLQYNYDVELSQEKNKRGYVVTARYYINPMSVDAFHADYVTPTNLAIKDLKQALNK
ncbi:MAG: hypothetical protein EOO07_21515 [Chitinophagaceae bacterium]|nr:MAG: hypothetical protein EOO07_21515 [Chitinophagaceae bacterium]